MRLLKFILIPALISYSVNLICFSYSSKSVLQNHKCCKDQENSQEIEKQYTGKSMHSSEHCCTCKFHCCHQPYVGQNSYQYNFKPIQEDTIYTQGFHPNIFEVELFKPPSFLS